VKSEETNFEIIPGEKHGREMFRLLFSQNLIATLSVMVKTKAVKDVGLFDEDRKYQNCEDYDLWLRLARNGASFYGMPERLMRYRRHSESSTHTPSKVFRPMLAVILKHASDPEIEPSRARQRIRSVYRELIAALVLEGQLDEARREMREFSRWDSRGVVTRLQQLLLRSFPGQFNYVSRECLFRAEWHLRSS
jgi:GT2 family glycosyltransferase